METADTLHIIEDQPEPHIVEILDVLADHTTALKDAGVATHLIGHNLRYHPEYGTVPLVDEATAMFGVHLCNGLVEVRGRWETPGNYELYEEWRWTAHGDAKAGFLFGYDTDEQHRLTPEQSQLIESLITPETTTWGYRHPDGGEAGLDLQAVRRIYTSKHRPITHLAIAPAEHMSSAELLDLYLPGIPTDQAACVASTALLLEQSIKSQVSTESQNRLMVLLVRSQNVAKDYESEEWKKAQHAISCALGVYLEASKRKMTGIVSKYANPNSSLRPQDLFAYGQIGLMSALERFDLGSSNQFWSYAYGRVNGEILDNLRSYGAIITIPRSAMEADKRHNYELAKDPQYLAKLPREEKDDIEQELGELVLMRPKSLDVITQTEDSQRNRIELVSDDSADDAYDMLESQQISDQILEMVDRLPHKLAEIVKMYYGLGTYEGTTLVEIGLALGLSESRISQNLSKALKMLERLLKTSKYKQLL